MSAHTIWKPPLRPSDALSQASRAALSAARERRDAIITPLHEALIASLQAAKELMEAAQAEAMRNRESAFQQAAIRKQETIRNAQQPLNSEGIYQSARQAAADACNATIAAAKKRRNEGIDRALHAYALNKGSAGARRLRAIAIETEYEAFKECKLAAQAERDRLVREAYDLYWREVDAARPKSITAITTKADRIYRLEQSAALRQFIDARDEADRAYKAAREEAIVKFHAACKPAHEAYRIAQEARQAIWQRYGETRDEAQAIAELEALSAE